MEAKDKATKTESATKERKKELKCGIIMPISAIAECSKQHWEEVKCIIEEAIVEAKFVPNLVSDANDSGIIQSRIVQNIYDNEMVVCDVSCKNPNVMFELGMRLAFDKPTIIIMDSQTTYSFDTAPIEHIGYPRDLNYHSINEFKKKLSQKIKATYDSYTSNQGNSFLKHFGEFKVAKIEHTEGSADAVILSKLETLEQQIRNIKVPVQRDTTYAQDPIRRVVNDAICEYCDLKDIKFEKLMFSDEDMPERRELINYLEEKSYIRKLCGNPRVLRQTIKDILNPF